jgi:hypothetical protein
MQISLHHGQPAMFYPKYAFLLKIRLNLLLDALIVLDRMTPAARPPPRRGGPPRPAASPA